MKTNCFFKTIFKTIFKTGFVTLAFCVSLGLTNLHGMQKLRVQEKLAHALEKTGPTVKAKLVVLKSHLESLNINRKTITAIMTHEKIWEVVAFITLTPIAICVGSELLAGFFHLVASCALLGINIWAPVATSMLLALRAYCNQTDKKSWHDSIKDDLCKIPGFVKHWVAIVRNYREVFACTKASLTKAKDRAHVCVQEMLDAIARGLSSQEVPAEAPVTAGQDPETASVEGQALPVYGPHLPEHLALTFKPDAQTQKTVLEAQGQPE